MSKLKFNKDRRKLLKAFSALSSAVALGGFGSFSSLANTSGEYRALVYIFLKGGNDSYNTLVPRDAGGLRTRYEQGRRVVAIPSGQLHALNLQSSAKIFGGESYDGFGLHPNCADLASMFNRQELSFIANVGTMISPVTRTQYLQQSVELPPQLFSHSDQQIQYQSEPVKPFRYGWGGRCAELLGSFNPSINVSPLISTFGLNPFQVTLDGTINPFVLSATGITNLQGTNNEIGDLLENYFSEANQPISLISSKYSEVFRSASRATAIMSSAFDIAESNGVDYDGIFQAYGADNTNIGQQLKTVAKMIAGRDANVNQRPIFAVNMNGFDTHQNVLEDHGLLMRDLNNAIAAFRDVLIAQNDFDKAMGFVGSEFGRTFTPNGDNDAAGTDHGWGGHALAFGGMINGGHIFGTHPDLRLNQGLDVDNTRGRWIPTTSISQCCAPMARWMGIEDNDLNRVFPTLVNFESPFDASTNLDFIKG